MISNFNQNAGLSQSWQQFGLALIAFNLMMKKKKDFAPAKPSFIGERVHGRERQQLLLLLMVNYMKGMFITLRLLRAGIRFSCCQGPDDRCAYPQWGFISIFQRGRQSRTETDINHGSLCLHDYVFYLNMELWDYSKSWKGWNQQWRII